MSAACGTWSSAGVESEASLDSTTVVRRHWIQPGGGSCSQAAASTSVLRSSS